MQNVKVLFDKIDAPLRKIGNRYARFVISSETVDNSSAWNRAQQQSLTFAMKPVQTDPKDANAIGQRSRSA